MNLRSGHVGTGSGRGSTGAGAGFGLGEGHDDNGCGNVESHEAPLLGPPSPPPPPPPLMAPAEMMAEVLAARRETARALELMAQPIGGFARGAPVAMARTGVVPAVSRGPVLTRTF
jgi:hypothetical protein